MKLDDLRKKARAGRTATHPETFTLPPEMTPELWRHLSDLSRLPLGQKPLKGSREERLNQALEKLELVIQSANGYYMIRDKGRSQLAWKARHAASVESNILPMIKVPIFK